MLTPTTKSIDNFQDSFEPKTEYRLSDIQLEIPDDSTAVFTAATQGPAGATAWVRAWVSNAADGALGEAELGNVAVGDQVTLTVVLAREGTPERPVCGSNRNGWPPNTRSMLNSNERLRQSLRKNDTPTPDSLDWVWL